MEKVIQAFKNFPMADCVYLDEASGEAFMSYAARPGLKKITRQEYMSKKRRTTKKTK